MYATTKSTFNLAAVISVFIVLIEHLKELIHYFFLATICLLIAKWVFNNRELIRDYLFLKKPKIDYSVAFQDLPKESAEEIPTPELVSVGTVEEVKVFDSDIPNFWEETEPASTADREYISALVKEFPNASKRQEFCDKLKLVGYGSKIKNSRSFEKYLLAQNLKIKTIEEARLNLTFA